MLGVRVEVRTGGSLVRGSRYFEVVASFLIHLYGDLNLVLVLGLGLGLGLG